MRSRLRRGLGVVLGLAVGYLVFGGSLRSAAELARRAPRPEPARSVPGAANAASAPTAAEFLHVEAAPAPSERIPPGAAQAVAVESACPSEMVLVSGEYCTNVEHTCKRWLDDDLLPYARCAEYEPPARCVGKRTNLKFCIDQREYTPAGETLPQNYASFIEASKVCERSGKRVCTESEWNFACEGPDMLPYPYGWTREDVCNQDRLDLFELNPKRQVLRDHRKASGELAACKSPFGVYDMTGNMDEPVLREAQRYAYPFRNALKGGWWMAGRNRCRPATTAHDDHYRDIQIGIRCCQTPA
jgi:formylglycine-generating enzyme